MRTSRFTDKDIKGMAAEYKTGSTIRDLAEAYECSTPTVIRKLKDGGTKMRKRGRRLGVKVPRKPGHKKPGPKTSEEPKPTKKVKKAEPKKPAKKPAKKAKARRRKPARKA